MRQPPSPFRKIRWPHNTASLRPRGVFMMMPLYSFDPLRMAGRKKRGLSGGQPPMRLVRSRSIAAKRQTPQHASLFQKKRGPTTEITALEGSMVPNCQPLRATISEAAKRQTPERHSGFHKKEGCQRGEDSPMRWFVYSRSLWMMKRPNKSTPELASCSDKERGLPGTEGQPSQYSTDISRFRVGNEAAKSQTR